MHRTTTKSLPIARASRIVTRDKSLNPIQPGSRYLEKRKVLGETLNNKCTVTPVVDTEMEKTFVLYTNTYGCSLTSTHTVQPLDDSDLDGLHPTTGCRLVISYGVAPNGCWGRFLLRLARLHMIQLGKASLTEDLESIQKVVEKRAKDAP